ncbi:hypothetical protein RR48_11955 [Papilio machaon]|uniref:Uncharacterized protein n=1 Tax=Papilio machaon TaxID=76193 RepID=A0A194RKP2_PAPMA|nr:hypothetical protein RR48_11955 [Papilio machaon]
MHSRNFMIKESSSTKENSLKDPGGTKVTSKRFKLRISIIGAEKLFAPMRKKDQNTTEFPLKLRRFFKKAKKKILTKNVFKSKNVDSNKNVQDKSIIKNNEKMKCRTIATGFPVKINSIDFGCQYSLNSNCSMEIISHMLTRSISQMSSVDSMFDVEWRRRHQAKQPNTIHVFLYNVIRRFKQSKTKLTNKTKKNHILVLHVPERFSHTSTDTISSIYSRIRGKETPLNIQAQSQNSETGCTGHRPVNKICGPGEIYLKNDDSEKRELKINLLSSYHRLNNP